MIVYKEEGDFREGAMLLVDKPLTWTSFDVVNKIRWALKKKYGKLKVGHAGTLDPLATGLVIVCTGKWTREIEGYMGQKKEYVAEITLGATTPSFDLETEVDAEYPWEQIDEELLRSVLDRFTGVFQQIPPVFSAVRIDGKRAYEQARRGNGPDMPAREVYIQEIELLEFAPPQVRLRIVCGKGTYIRSLARDIGEACGSGAYLSALRRTAIGDYKIEQANKIDELVAFLEKEV